MLSLVGRGEEAVSSLEGALEVLLASGDTPNAGVFGAILAAVYARAGMHDRVVPALAAARSRLDVASDVWRARALEICDGHALLAEARAARAAHDVSRAAETLARAQRIAESEPSFRRGPPFESIEALEARVALRMLQDAITEARAASEPWRVAADGSTFQPPGKDVVVVPGRGATRRILALVASRRVARPGEALSRDELIAAGWPGERLRGGAATNRLYVALDALRRLGLRAALVRTPDGWALDPQVPCELCPDGT